MTRYTKKFLHASGGARVPGPALVNLREVVQFKFPVTRRVHHRIYYIDLIQLERRVAGHNTV